MNDGILVDALRARDPGALAALYDTYAEGVYRYCRAMLGSPDGAQVALRDTFVAAEALVGSLGDSAKFRPWLYALARGECLRRLMPGEPTPVDTGPLPVMTPPNGDPGDADLRNVAWSAVMGLDPRDREVLELATRHELSGAEVAAVLGTGERYAEGLRETAVARLRDAVTAEILARQEPRGCHRLAGILAGFGGDLPREMRDRVTRHRARCEICSRRGIKQISAAKVFALLPEITLPGALRVRVLSCFIDPELVPYRRFVARRIGPLDISGFPRSGIRGEGRVAQAIAGTVAAVAAVAAVVLVLAQVVGSPEERITTITARRVPVPSGTSVVAAPPPAQAAKPERTPTLIMPVAEETPIDSLGPRKLVAAVPGVPNRPQPTPEPLPAPTWSKPQGPFHPPSWPHRPTPRPTSPAPTTPTPTPTPTHTPTPEPSEPTTPPTAPTPPTEPPTSHPRPPHEHQHGSGHPRPHRERDCPPSAEPRPRPSHPGGSHPRPERRAEPRPERRAEPRPERRAEPRPEPEQPAPPAPEPTPSVEPTARPAAPSE